MIDVCDRNSMFTDMSYMSTQCHLLADSKWSLFRRDHSLLSFNNNVFVSCCEDPSVLCLHAAVTWPLSQLVYSVSRGQKQNNEATAVTITSPKKVRSQITTKFDNNECWKW